MAKNSPCCVLGPQHFTAAKKSGLAHNAAWGLHNPYILRGAQCFAAREKFKTGPQMGLLNK